MLSGFGRKIVMKHINTSLIDDLFCLKVILLLHQCLLSEWHFAAVCNEEDGMVTDRTPYDFPIT